VVERPFSAYAGDQPYVFVSYAHDDAELVFPQLSWLHDQGINIWYDEGISPGTRWSEELATALKQASVLLYFSTPRSVASRHCLDEVNFALDGETPTITVFLEETELTPGLQLRLSSHQAIIKHQLNETEYRHKLLSTLTSILGVRTESKATTSPETMPEKTNRVPMVAGLGALAIVVSLGVWFTSTSEDIEPAPPLAETTDPPNDPVPVAEAPADARPSIAVLPFDNFSPSEDNAFFAAGIHEDILSSLSKIDGLKVISRTSVMRYQNREKHLPDIAAELGVGHVLEGSVRRAGNQVRITVQLIEASTDEHLWSETYDRELADIFAVQSEVAENITGKLKVELSVDVLESIRTAPTQNMVAYDLYLRGRSGIMSQSASGFQEGMALMQQALAEDPNFALAHAWVAGSYVLLVEAGIEWQTVRDVAFASAEKAVQLAPNEAESNLFLGTAYFRDLQPGKADQYLNRAIELDPNNLFALTMRSDVAQMQGNATLAYDLRRRALQVSPLDASANITMAWSLQQMGESDEALRHVNRAVELEPASLPYRRAGDFYWLSGDFYQAARHYFLGHKSDPTNLAHSLNIVALMNWLGDPQAAERWLRQAELIAPNHDFVYVQKMDFLNASKRYEEAEAVLEQWQAYNPTSASSPRYVSLFQQLQARYAYEAERYDEAAGLNESAFEIARKSVERLRGEEDRLIPDVLSSWSVLRYAVAAKVSGNEESFNEAKQALFNLYESPGSLGWEDFQLATLHAVSGNRELALEHLRRTPDSGFNAIWILETLELDTYDLSGDIGNDVGYKQVKDTLQDRNEVTLARLRKDLPELFAP
jgi:TolB-like protein/Flp pilus assembly protein TadD